MSQPTLPALPALKLPPEVATIGSMLIGLATLTATTLGVSPDVTNAAVLALQYLIGVIALVVGLLGHLHIHNQHVSLARAAMEINGVQSAVQSAPDAHAVTPPPATNAPVSPSYAPLPSGTAGMLTVSTPASTVNAPTQTAPDAPQAPAVDTPVQVVPVVADTPPATPQAATDAT